MLILMILFRTGMEICTFIFNIDINHMLQFIFVHKQYSGSMTSSCCVIDRSLRKKRERFLSDRDLSFVESFYKRPYDFFSLHSSCVWPWNCLKDVCDGYGTLVYSDGTKYVGYFKDSKRNGRGELIDANDNVIHSGLWSADQFLDNCM